MHLSAQTHYQAELDAGRFCIQQCPQCARHVFSPMRWVRASGQGTVYSTSTVARKSDAGGNYNVALIDLDEGVRMMGRVEGIAPEAVQIGQRVSAHVAQKDGRGLVLFQPAVQQPSQGGAA
jgi:uncharacterized OB-fold protein